MRVGRLTVAVVMVGAACAGDDDGGSEAAGTTARADRAPQEAPGACTPARPAEAGTRARTLEFDGLERSYELTVPESYDGAAAVPLVLNLHGFTGNGAQQDLTSGMPASAGERGYVVAAPDGGPLEIAGVFAPGGEGAEQYEGQPFWNMFGPGDVDFGPPNGQNLGIDSSEVGADDVGFLDALLDEIAAELCVDGDRLYATGMSNGAGMATMLGCALGDRLAAIAPVAGVNLTGKCPESAPVSVLALHGDADDVVLYGGDGLLGFAFGNPSVPDRMAQWAARNECAAEPVTEQPDSGLTIDRWPGCADGVDVELWTLAGWGHAWPGAAFEEAPGPLDATETILDFFEAHPRS